MSTLDSRRVYVRKDGVLVLGRRRDLRGGRLVAGRRRGRIVQAGKGKREGKKDLFFNAVLLRFSFGVLPLLVPPTFLLLHLYGQADRDGQHRQHQEEHQQEVGVHLST